MLSGRCWKRKWVAHPAKPLVEQQRGEKAIGYQGKLETCEIALVTGTKIYYRAQRRDN
jgi:hypothetical protein